MIRVLISAASPVAKARLADRIRSFPGLQLAEASPEQMVSPSELQQDVYVAEIETDDGNTVVPDYPASGIPLILLVSSHSPMPVDAIRQGAHAVLPSDLTDAQLVAAIEAVAAGLGVFILEETQESVQPFATYNPPPRLLEALTSREIEVLRALADGLANKEIAVRLRISENTVKFHVGSVMGKLGASSRTEAVMLGVRQGIVLI